ncbi:unnamed protein product [Schistocephalus solidus]|uniref:Uncharacterized protein n=1 Tax=Schistocephalus solidus TaxID=70667 RepID=A0A183SKY4_SCHSO|nr:unnamed protein product [Schistocephalus solidus]
MSDFQRLVTHVHRSFYGEDQTTQDHARANEIRPADYALLGGVSHTSIVPAYTRDYFDKETQWTDRHYRRQLLPKHLGRYALDCPSRAFEDHSTELYVRQREHASMLGRLLAERAIGGIKAEQHAKQKFQPDEELICKEVKDDSTTPPHPPPVGYARAVKLVSDGCNDVCRLQKYQKLQDAHELSGRLFF